jgi:hypothetical protein
VVFALCPGRLYLACLRDPTGNTICALQELG